PKPACQWLASFGRAGCGGGISTPLQLHCVKEGTVGDMIVRIDLVERYIPRLEVDKLVGSRAHRREVVGCVAGVCSGVRGKAVLREYGHIPTGPPEGRWRCEHYLDRVVIELVDPQDACITTDGDGSGGGVGSILPGEDRVIGGEGRPIVPDYPQLEVPQGPGAIRRAAAVLQARDLRRQDRDIVPLGIQGAEWFVDD